MKDCAALRFILLCSLLILPQQVDAEPRSLSGAILLERDGQTISFKEFSGRWILINYWATWCAGCIEEFPILTRLSLNPKLVVIGLSDESISVEHWRAFRNSHNLPYHVALIDKNSLPDQIPASAYFLEMRPISYLITPSGLVAKRFLGEVTESEIQDAMK